MRIFCIFVFFFFSLPTFAQDGTLVPQIRCQPDENVFEFVLGYPNKIEHGSFQYPLIGPDLSNTLPESCTLKTEPEITITLNKSLVSAGNPMSQCGGSPTSQQLIVNVNDEPKIIFPAAYNRCLGGLGNADHYKPFQEQMKWPGYIKITENSVMMLDIDIRDGVYKITDFSFQTLPYFLGQRGP